MTKTEQKYIEIDRLMRRYDVEPDGLLDFAEKHLPKYLFYSQKEHRAYCSACKQTFKPVKGLKTNEPAICPKCGAEVIAKSEGRIGKLTDIVWSVWLQNDGDDICTHYYRTVADYTDDFRQPEINTTEQYRNIHGSEFHDYMWWHSNHVGMICRDRWMPYAERGGGCLYAFKSEFYEPCEPYVFGDAEAAVKRSRFRYCPINALLDVHGRTGAETVERFIIDGWLNTYKLIPQIELTVKVGFKSLTYAVRQQEVKLNDKATDVCDALGVTKRQYKELLKISDPNKDEFNALRKYNCSAETARWIAMLGDNWDTNRKLDDLEGLAPLEKLKQYIEGIGNDLASYTDYVKRLMQLGYDYKDKAYLFPKDFWKAHDRLMEQQYADQDKGNNAKIKRMAAKCKCNLHFGGMFCRPARSATELRKEGAVLHHCVATYAERMARGETLIMFIRKETDPDSPFFTMEVCNGKIVQVRGLRNCAPTAEVTAFRNEFEKVLQAESQKKNSRKKTAA